MPKKNPISLDEASQILIEKLDEPFRAMNHGDQPGQYGWYKKNFVTWISELGYHIELSGDEFEMYILGDKVA